MIRSFQQFDQMIHLHKNMKKKNGTIDTIVEAQRLKGIFISSLAVFIRELIKEFSQFFFQVLMPGTPN